MYRNSALTIAAFALIAFAAVNWAKISRTWSPPRELPGLEMLEIKPGDYNLTILVPNVLERVYYTKPVKIEQPFEISQFEITIDQWNICFNDGGCSHPAKHKKYQKGNHPVTRVSWADAMSFSNWLSRETGETYRLPTEEEWGYFANSGKDFTEKTIEDLIARRQMERTTPLNLFRKTQRVGTVDKNEWGVTDLTGPVWEWTMTCRFPSDDANRKNYTIEQLRNFRLCPNRIVQGDERAHVPFFFDEVYTGGCGTGAPVDNIGFRVLKELS